VCRPFRWIAVSDWGSGLGSDYSGIAGIGMLLLVPAAVRQVWGVLVLPLVWVCLCLWLLWAAERCGRCCYCCCCCDRRQPTQRWPSSRSPSFVF